jgi:hypothetical protein
VAMDRTVLHEAVSKECLLARANVLGSEDRLPRFRDDAGGNRRAFAINTNREIPQDRKTNNESEDNTMEPARGELALQACVLLDENPSACGLSRFSLVKANPTIQLCVSRIHFIY